MDVVQHSSMVLSMADELNDLRNLAELKTKTRDQLQLEFDRLLHASNQAELHESLLGRQVEMMKGKADVAQEVGRFGDCRR